MSVMRTPHGRPFLTLRRLWFCVPLVALAVWFAWSWASYRRWWAACERYDREFGRSWTVRQPVGQAGVQTCTVIFCSHCRCFHYATLPPPPPGFSEWQESWAYDDRQRRHLDRRFMLERVLQARSDCPHRQE